jgi:hypothetical protein
MICFLFPASVLWPGFVGQPRFNCNLVGGHGKRNRLKQMVGGSVMVKIDQCCSAALIGGRVWSTSSLAKICAAGLPP